MADSKLTALTALTDPQLTDLLYMVDDPSGTPLSKKATVQDVLALSLWAPPEGMRLSASTNTYVTTSDVTAAGTIYWTPVISGGHGTVTGYNGTVIASKSVTQKSLALTVTSGKNYDVFYDYDGDVLALSAAWTTDTARADALADEQGAIVLGSDHTKLWLGTIRASAANQIEDSNVKRFVWNAYNQASRSLLRQEATTSWTYTTATYRQANAASANRVETVVGRLGNLINLTAAVVADNTFASVLYATAIGEDSTTTPDAANQPSSAYAGTAQYTAIVSTLTKAVPLGYHAYNWLEISVATGTTTFYGNLLITGQTIQQSGLSGFIEA